MLLGLTVLVIINLHGACVFKIWLADDFDARPMAASGPGLARRPYVRQRSPDPYPQEQSFANEKWDDHGICLPLSKQFDASPKAAHKRSLQALRKRATWSNLGITPTHDCISISPIGGYLVFLIASPWSKLTSHCEEDIQSALWVCTNTRWEASAARFA